jgi:hypothetical protein
MELSIPGMEGMMPRLSEEEVLRATVDQLNKDLALGGGGVRPVTVGPDAFEELRAQVTPLLESMGGHDRQVALYRVDVPESWTREALAVGGTHELAGRVVLRALQKVLTRLRFGGGGTP